MTHHRKALTKRKGTLPAFTPVPRKTQRHDGWTAERQRGFIEALADTGSVRAAANAVGMTPEGAYVLRRHAEAGTFRKAWEAALALGVQRLEDIAMDRALNGVEVPVYSYGKLVGTRRIYNDRLLMFLLRNRAPRRFAADGGGPKRMGGLDAIERHRLKRMKSEWRKEWEAERAARDERALESETGEIDTMLDTMRERWLAAMSPATRAAYEAFQAAQQADEDAGYRAWQDPEHASYIDPARPSEEEEGPPQPPDWLFPEEEELEKECGPKVRTMKDEGWD